MDDSKQYETQILSGNQDSDSRQKQEGSEKTNSQEAMGNPGPPLQTGQSVQTAGVLSCAVIRDLLPVCADGLASADSQKLVRNHLDSCQDCRALYEAMQMREPEMSPDESRMVSALTTVQRRNRKKTICIWLLALSGLFLLIHSAILFYQGAILPSSLMKIQVAQKSDNTLQVDLSSLPKSSGFLWAGSEEKTEGRICLKVLGGKGLLNQKSSMSISVSSSHPIQELFCNDTLIWQDGYEIEPMIDRLYSQKDGYAGDVSRAGLLMDLLQFRLPDTSFHLSMNTEDPQACIWTFIPEKTESGLYRQLAASLPELRSRAALMLLLTPNLDAVYLDPSEKEGQTDDQPVMVLSRSVLVEWLEQHDLSSTLQSPADLQKIWNALQTG